ncbi:MAG: DNA-binding protein WhiA [Clostridia bacterium]|nr:DNA-binding protein WhiA [Clostridia bacterium]
MSFSGNLRRELAKAGVERQCCAVAELNGAILASSGLSFRGPGRYGIGLNLDSQSSAERYKSIIQKFFGVDCAMTKLDTSRLGGLTRYAVIVPEQYGFALAEKLSLFDPDAPFGMRSAPTEDALSSEHCKKAFLRGAYIVAGAAADPQKGYHLEIDVPDRQLAASITSVFGFFDINVRVSERKQRFAVYIKDGDHMSAALALMGAYNALLEFENTRVLRDCRNSANRLVNCDSANVDKSVAAAERQISAIKTISHTAGLDSLPDQLRELAYARLNFPYSSLAELGASLNPPIGKSGVNARMRKIQLIAEDLSANRR